MQLERTSDERPSAGFGGVLRMGAVLAILGLAAVAILSVLGLLPREIAEDYALKVGVVVGIGVVAGVAIGLVARRR